MFRSADKRMQYTVNGLTLDLLHQSDFRARFLAKGRFAAFNRDIPAFIVKHPHPGLLGAALLCRA